MASNGTPDGTLYVDFADRAPLSTQERLIVRAIISSYHETAVGLLLVSMKVDAVAAGRRGVPLTHEDIERQARLTQAWVDRCFPPEFGLKVRYERG